MNTALLFVLVVLSSALLAVVGQILVQRWVPLSIRESHSANIGIIYAALYVMFGVMVGFSAYLVLNKYETSLSMTQSEAGSIEQLYWLAEQFPEPQRDRIQELAASYARVVVDEEWPLMGEGQVSTRAGTLANELRRELQGFKSSTSAEQALFTQGLERVHDLEEAREVRLLNVREGIPLILWVVLVSLGIVTVVFTYFIGIKTIWIHRLAVGALAAGIALVLFAIGALDRPFDGDYRVGPDAFELTLQTIEGTDGQ